MKTNFKRSTAWLLCLALLLGLFAGIPGAVLTKASAAADAVVDENNLILNPDFEDYAITGWTITEGAVQTKLDGNYVLKIAVKDASATSEAISVAAGYTYTATVNVLGAAKLSVVFYNADGEVIAEESSEATAAEWSELKVDANAPAGAVAAAVKLAATTAEAVYFDDVALAMGDLWATANLLNGGFENWNVAGTKPDYWSISSAANGSFAAASAEEVEGRGKVVVFNRNEQKMQMTSAMFDVVAGTPYVFTMDMFQTAAANFQLYFRFYTADGKTKFNPMSVPYSHTYDDFGANIPLNEWTTIAFSAVAPADAVKGEILITAPWVATNVTKFDNAAVTVPTSILDGSFENGLTNAGLASGHAGRNIKAGDHTNTNPEYVKEGEQSLYDAKGIWYYGNHISVIPGETYKASIFIKTTPEQVAAWGEEPKASQLYLYYYDSTGAVVGSKQATAVATADGWTEIVVERKAPEGAVIARTLFTAAGAAVYADCESVTKTTNVFGSTSVANADFETCISGDSNIKDWMTGNTNSKVYTGMDYEPGRGYVATVKDWYAIGGSLRSTVIAVTPGKTYAVSLDVKGEATTEWIQICLKFYGEDGKEISGSQGMKQLSGDKGEITSEWVTATFTKAAPEGAVTARIYLSLAGQYEKNHDGIDGTADDTQNTCYEPIDLCLDNASLTLVCEHDFTGAAVVTEPTCATAGSSVVTCPNCGATSTTVIAATGNHTWDDGVVTAPTCSDKGYTTYTCAVCGTTETRDETATIDHTWGEGVYTAPTTEADGYTTYTCSVCGGTKVETDEGTQLVPTAQLIRDGAVVATYNTVAEALANLQAGDTIKLIADAHEGFNLAAVDKVTFDGNGFTVYGVVRVQHTAGVTVSGLTITNVVFNAENQFDEKNNPLSYLVISQGYHEDLTIQDCIFENSANLSTYNTDGVKNLTITGCTFDGVANNAGTATAIKLSKVENLTVTYNEILSVEWNVFQIGESTGTLLFQNNNIVWDTERDDVDGAYNLHSLYDAKVLLAGNQYELGANNADKNVVNVQIAATNVALFSYDNVKVNEELFDFHEGTVYCTGHIDADENDACDLCNTAIAPAGPETAADLVFLQAPSLSFQDYIGMQLLANGALANTYDELYVEAVQIDPVKGATTTKLTGMPYYGVYLLFDQQILSWSMAEEVT
ncbi:MAG: hypothetical protein E7447_04765, partial [Ruminococcaceae bacterium]|nr:hypothetical protein [Oscillospiraceae bacterium]